MKVVKYCIFAAGIVFFVVGCKGKNYSSKGESMAKVMKITWQRLVDEKGQTCERCGSTEKELQKAFQSLKKSLTPLGIKVILVKKTLDPVTCAKDISQSNRIWVGEHALEEWLGAQVGKSPCEFCCAELGGQIECRTVELRGQLYETIPADLIVKAGLLAAANLYEEPSAKTCCPGETAVATIKQTTCPVMDGAINKNIFTEYKGKKVYFCCPSCKDVFEKDPEKYVSKLPQFQN